MISVTWDCWSFLARVSTIDFTAVRSDFKLLVVAQTNSDQKNRIGSPREATIMKKKSPDMPIRRYTETLGGTAPDTDSFHAIWCRIRNHPDPAKFTSAETRLRLCSGAESGPRNLGTIAFAKNTLGQIIDKHARYAGD